jgi:hypothetical protein
VRVLGANGVNGQAFERPQLCLLLEVISVALWGILVVSVIIPGLEIFAFLGCWYVSYGIFLGYLFRPMGKDYHMLALYQSKPLIEEQRYAFAVRVGCFNVLSLQPYLKRH